MVITKIKFIKFDKRNFKRHGYIFIFLETSNLMLLKKFLKIFSEKKGILHVLY